MTPEKSMEDYGLTQKELITHFQAFESLSYRGSKAKLSKIPQDTRDKISRFYRTCREHGYYPWGHLNGKMVFILSTPIKKETQNYGDHEKGAEYLKNIQLLLSKHRNPGEGQKMADQIVKHMEGL